MRTLSARGSTCSSKQLSAFLRPSLKTTKRRNFFEIGHGGSGSMGTFSVDLMMSTLAQHIKALSTLQVDGVELRAKLGNGTEDVLIVHFLFLCYDMMRDLM
jgi:hypothetical protein